MHCSGVGRGEGVLQCDGVCQEFKEKLEKVQGGGSEIHVFSEIFFYVKDFVNNFLNLRVIYLVKIFVFL